MAIAHQGISPAASYALYEPGLAGGRHIGILSLLLAAIVLAATPSQAAPEPLNLNIENLIAIHRPDYDADVLQPLATAHEAAREAEAKVQAQRPLEQKRVESRSVVQAAQDSVNCLEAAKATWPPELLNDATLVMERESSVQKDAIGPMQKNGQPGYNADGSQDFGCFQINNFAHADFFAAHDWRDPYQNAAEGYQIYLGRHNFTAWYGVKGILF